MDEFKKISVPHTGSPDHPTGGKCKICKCVLPEPWGDPESIALKKRLGLMIPITTCDKCYRDLAENEMNKASEQAMKASADQWGRVCPDEYKKEITLSMIDSKSYHESVKWQYNSRGLLLIGPSGEGKTRTVWKILKRQYQNGKSFEFYSGNDFGKVAAHAAREGQEREFTRNLTHYVDILVLDDLGNGKMTPLIESELFDIIDKRMSNHRPTFVTTQYNSESLAARFRLSPEMTEAITRRLRESSNVIIFGKRTTKR